MRQFWKFVVASLLAVALIGTISAAYRQTVYQGNVATLTASTASTVRLFENAVSETVGAIDLIVARGHNDCSPQSRRVLDEAVFLTSQIKDILASKGGATCSASGFGSKLMRVYLSPPSTLSRPENDVVFHAIPDQFPGIGISRVGLEDDAIVLALVNANSFAAAAIDAALEQQASVAILADDGTPIVKTPNFMLGAVNDGFLRFSSRSAIYPFSVVLEIPRTQMYAGYAAYPLGTAALIALLCLAAGWLVTTRFILYDKPSDIIRQAINASEIMPYFQPIVDLQSGHIEGFEILSRWVKPSGQIVGPSEFIAEVERFSLSPLLLRSLATQTGQAMGQLISRFPNLRFAFNVPPDAFVQPDFVDHFIDVLAAAGIDPKSATVEVTERQEIPDVTQARIAVQQLQTAGVKVSIDDVGTGHNGLSMIAAMAPNVIKIDKYFIDGLPGNQRAHSMVEMLVRTARSLGMQTVAEGVETHAQVEALMALGVDYGQGYHIARPMAPDRAISLFRNHREYVEAVPTKQVLPDRALTVEERPSDTERSVAVAA